jgi:hypothetical protein
VSWPDSVDAGPEALEAVEVRAGVGHLVGPVELLVALEVAEVAGELDLDEGRAAAVAGPGHGLPRRLVDGEEVEPVDDHARHAERRRPVRDVVGGHRPARRGGLGVAVVLRHEDGGEVPDRRQVERLERGALVGGAVAEERDRDAAVALVLGRERAPADQRRATADDAVGAEHALGQVGDVHRAALAPARPGGLAVDLGHHPDRVDALGDAVPVAAVGGGDRVAVVEVRADADGRGLLARVQVHEAGDVAARELVVHALLELADGLHRAVGVEQLVGGELLAGGAFQGAGHTITIPPSTMTA